MPLLLKSTYRPPVFLRNGHLNTIFAGAFRKISNVSYERERLDTPDGDFLDIDWSKVGSEKLVIVLHGLEGSADRPYTLGIIRHFNRHGWDGLGMNFRGCSGEPNRLLRTYHVGETGDLDFVIQHVLSLDYYREVVLVGFSLGGNVTLKYAGEKGHNVPKIVKKAIALSVPCHVPSANKVFKNWENKLYMHRFMQSLNQKMKMKAAQFPNKIRITGKLPHNFDTFDEVFTAPVHGFKNALDYWTRNSSLPFFERISIPTLLINAKDDSFLSPECYPDNLAKKHRYLHLEIPSWGGHCGFVTLGKNGAYWSDERALAFAEADL